MAEAPGSGCSAADRRPHVGVRQRSAGAEERAHPVSQPSNGDVTQTKRHSENPGAVHLAGTRDLPRPPLRPHRSRAESCSPGGCGDSSLRSRDDDAQVGEGADSGAAAPFRGDLARREIRLIRDHEWEGPRISPMSPLASCALKCHLPITQGSAAGTTLAASQRVDAHSGESNQRCSPQRAGARVRCTGAAPHDYRTHTRYDIPRSHVKDEPDYHSS